MMLKHDMGFPDDLIRCEDLRILVNQGAKRFNAVLKVQLRLCPHQPDEDRRINPVGLGRGVVRTDHILTAGSESAKLRSAGNNGTVWPPSDSRWDVLRNVISVAATLGERRADDDGDGSFTSTASSPLTLSIGSS